MKNRLLTNKKIVLTGILVLAAALTISGIFLYRKNSMPAIQNENEPALTNHINEINVLGEVKCTRIENISIDFPALVTDVLVKDGDRVTLGEPLVTLDLTEFNGNVEKLKQQLIACQESLPAARQDISALQADIDQIQREISRKAQEYSNDTNSDLKLLQNTLSLAQKEFEKAQNDFKSFQALYDAGATSKDTLKQYENALNQRQKAVNDVQDNLQKIRTALKDELDQLNVGLKAKRVQLSQLQTGNNANTTKQQSSIYSAQIDLNLMTAKAAKNYINNNQIVSHIKNGIVQNITVINGNHLGIQGTPTKVLEIMDADSITISAEVDEEFISSIKVGDNVKIAPTFVPNVMLDGIVIQIPNLAIEKDGKRVIRVLIKPNDPDGLLKPGYTADVYYNK